MAPLIQPADGNKRLQRVYGPDFPGLVKDGDKWRTWLDAKSKEQETAVRDRRFHFSRHDQFRVGNQWLSTRDGRTLREPKADKNSMRLTENIIGPALDFRHGIIAEQRAGFRLEPITGGTIARETAEAQQAFAEYYYYMLRAWSLFLDAAFWSQTQGVAFLHVFVDKNAGPSHEDVEIIPPDDERYASLKAEGYEVAPDGINLIVPLTETGDYDAPGATVRQIYEGDIRSRVVLAAETLADPEARTINGPHDAARWFMSRRVRDLRAVKLEIDDPELEGENVSSSDDGAADVTGGFGYQRGLPAFPTRRLQTFKESVTDTYLWLAKNKSALPEGAWLRVVGKKLVTLEEELPGGVIPFAAFRDGTPDPQLYPRPTVSDWIPDQTAINALKTEIMQTARMMKGRLMARKGSIITESYTTVTGSIIEHDGPAPTAAPQVTASKDLYAQYAQWKQSLEDKTGWNATTRGSVSGTGSMQDVSGRALLAARETFERTLGPFVRGIAEGATEWANIVVQLGRYITTTPRTIPAVGRPDLALRITRDKLGNGDRALVYADPETMIPMPHALRMQILEDQLDKGRISLEQYQKRAPYADVRTLTMGDTQQWERAQWINTIIEERWEELANLDPVALYAPETGFTILWTDTPAVHKRALSELIMDDRKKWFLRKLAIDRWGILDQLERAQLDPTGTIPIPFEVIGVPLDKVMVQMPQPMVPQPQPGTPAAGGGGTPGQLPTGAVPSMSSTVPPAAAMDTAEPLGSFGAAEQALPQ